MFLNGELNGIQLIKKYMKSIWTNIERKYKGVE
jgi:hypothetical protein